MADKRYGRQTPTQSVVLPYTHSHGEDAIELYGLVHGEQILHTAHRTPTSSSAFSRLYDLITKAGYEEKKDFYVYRQYGLELIEIIDGSGGKASFRTRTAKGGLGEGFDILIIDEAQEYQNDQETTLKYLVSSSMNPQTLLCGTPPTPISSGTVRRSDRLSAMRGHIDIDLRIPHS
ncbi:MAG: hypothetical protein PUB39_06945 [Eubacteriales bacterium]|nr:hypothetical protein [Eubacteriales bacterium]